MEVDLPRFPIFQRAFDPRKKPDRPKIHILVKATANGDDQSQERNVVGHPRIPDSAKKNSIEFRQLLKAVHRHHRSGADILFAAPIKLVPGKFELEAAARGFENADTFWNYFLSDAVTGDNRDVETSHVL